MRFALLGLVVFACSPDITPLPPLGGGGGGTGGGSNGSNPGSPTGDANSDELEGLVCVMPDPRDFTVCQATGAGGITVALTGVGSALTADDGTFTLPIPTGTNLSWTITGANMVTSTMGFSTSAVVFAMTEPTFQQLLADNSIPFDASTGMVIGTVLHGGSGLALVTVDATPVGTAGGTFYATPDDQVDWPGTSTSALGSFMIPGLGSALETLAVTPPGPGSGSGSGSAEIINNVPTTAGGATFISVQL